MLKKNDKFTASITDVTNLGYGVAKVDGETVFVRSAVTGDTVDAVVIKKYPSYAIAVPERIAKASVHRCEQDCKVFPSCGGCAYRHIEYSYERELKKQYVKACFNKEGIDVEVAHVSYSATRNYRNKVQYPVAKGKDGKLFLGFYSEYSHRAVDSTGCHTESLSFVKVKEIVTKLFNELNYSAYDEKSGRGLIRHVFLRCNKYGDVHVCLTINGNTLPKAEEFISCLTALCPEIVGISININTENTNVVLGDKTIPLWGSQYLLDEICGKSFEINPKSFWQINRDTAEMLYEKGKELLKLQPDDVLLDLYCGIGSIGLSVSDKENKLFGVEIVPEAVEDAKRNALRNEMNSACFACGDAKIGFAKCLETFGRIDAVVVDPPRKGISSEVIDDIAKSNVDKLLYISCNPATLARDVHMLMNSGFRPSVVYPYDMFPRTGHVEAMCLLSKFNTK